MDQLTRVKVDPVFFFAASSLLVAIFTVGTKPPYGVPRPVLNSTIWQRTRQGAGRYGIVTRRT
ncbi:hypothetical protein ACVXG9_22235 [Escherichia coli]